MCLSVHIAVEQRGLKVDGETLTAIWLPISLGAFILGALWLQIEWGWVG